MTRQEFCVCGQPLHYSDPVIQAQVETLIKEQGPDVEVSTGGRRWLIPRHYIALHGIKAQQLPMSKFPELIATGLRCYFEHRGGSVLVSLQTVDANDQLFTHRDDTGIVRNFHIRTLRARVNAKNSTLTSMAITPEDAKFVRTYHGINEQQLDLITEKRLHTPGLMCKFADGSEMIVDGNHRLVKRVALGETEMQFWMIPENVWKLALVRLPAIMSATFQ